MAITIKDIAREAGVSYSTVSRALNGLTVVNEKTKQHVLETAERLGYMPNTAAVNLKRNRSGMLAIYFSTINEMTSPEVLHEVVTAVYGVIREKFLVVVKGIDHHEAGSLNPMMFDGIIAITQSEADDPFLEEVLAKAIPVVTINRHPDLAVDTVQIDEEDAMYRAMQHLLAHGHRRIVVLEGPPHRTSNRMRHQGWTRALADAGLDPAAIPVYEGNFRFESAVRLAPEILAHKPTALLSFNDEMAFGVERVMLEQGLKVPDDLSIMGFDNWKNPVYAAMNLTSVERSMFKLVQQGMRILLERIEQKGSTYTPETVYLEAPLIQRGSVRDVNL